MTPDEQEPRDLDEASRYFHEQLNNVSRGDEYHDVFPSLQSEGLTWYVEYLDSVLRNIADPASVRFQQSLHELRKICSVKEVLPKSCTLLDSLLGCVYEGSFNGAKVRIRRVRTHPKGDPRKVKDTFHQVAVVWKHLAHPNIVPLLGVTIDPPQLISNRVSGGDLTEYITNNPDANRLTLVSDVAEGLNYLHSCNVIHGDLKGSNVLVDAAGRAQITDFGLAIVTQDMGSIRNALDEHAHSARWIAPEILDGQGTYTKEADVFSFAMVTVEVFTGAVPFCDKTPHEAVSAIIGGKRPPRPTHPALTDRLWAVTQRCWDREAHLRPNALQVSCSFGIPAWRRLIDRPLATDERVSLITGLFSDGDEIGRVKRLRGDDAQSFVDVIDEMLDSLAPWVRRKCLTTLSKICGRRGLLPRSIQIPLCYNRMNPPLCYGGFAEVWKGEHRGREVAVKVLKVSKATDLAKITRRFCEEVVAWKALRHPHVLPLLGVTMFATQFAMVSEWMVNGDISEFVKAHRDANRFELLKEVAQGLIYMHGEGMIHGDLKGANILVDIDGHARLADFGLLVIVSDSTHPTTLGSSGGGGTTRWMSPELLYPERFGFQNNRPTKESDCYALGMVVLEVLTGQVPFPLDIGFIVMRKVIDGEHPKRPQGAEAAWFTDDLWGTLEQCWSLQPKARPTVEAVLGRLERGSTAWRPLPPGADDDPEANSDDEPFITARSSLPDQMVTYGSDRSPVLSQNQPRRVDTDRNSLQLSPGRQQRPDEKPALIESNQEPVHPRDSDRRSKAPVDASVNCNLPKTSNRNHHGISHPVPPICAPRTPDSPQSDDTERRINKLSEELARGASSSRRERFIELRRLCGHHRTVPASYKLWGVTKEGEHAQCISKVTEIWKGRWMGKAVALKVLKGHRDDPRMQRIKSGFCKEMVLRRQISHKNILPLYGVSTTVSDFCLVYPWYNNGNIMDYSKENPDANQFYLLWDAANGLCYLHTRGLAHGSLKPSRILIDESGTAQLATAGCSSIIAVVAGYEQSGLDGDIDEYRYTAPELQRSEEHGAGKVDKILLTRMSDVYAMGMVVYAVLTMNAPYCDCNNTALLEKIRAGELPRKPSGIDETVWEFLRDCWNRDPTKRPSTAQVCDALLQFSLLPRLTPTPKGKLVGLPEILILRVKSIRLLLDGLIQQWFCVELKYGNKNHSTSLMRHKDGSGKYTWSGLEYWTFETNKQDNKQLVSVQLVIWYGHSSTRTCATGSFSLLNNVGGQINVKLEASDRTSSATLSILLTEMPQRVSSTKFKDPAGPPAPPKKYYP